MRHVALFIVIAAALSSSGFGATELRVQFDTTASGRQCLDHATLVVKAFSDDAEQRIAIYPAQTEVSVSLPGERATLRLTAAGCWSEAIEADARDKVVVLRLFRPAEVGGMLDADHGRWPSELEAAIFRPPAAPASAITANDSGHRLDCIFRQPQWQCVVPAGSPFDLRVTPKGFAPIHFWSVVAPPTQRLTLEPRQLRAGASLAGWVERPDGKPLPGAHLVLMPATQAAGDGSRTAVRQVSATTNQRGYFELTGLAAGEYRLVSRADGLSPVLLPTVNIRGDEQLVWPRTITHLPFAAVEVRVNPPLNADGKPWSVSLQARMPLNSSEPAPLRRTAAVDGTWRADHLRADAYRGTIEDANGTVVETFDLDLSKSGTMNVPITVHRLLVRGVVRFGDDPLNAEIIFANGRGRTVKTKTNDLGEYEASFPVAGSWTPTLYPRGSDGPRIGAKPLAIPDSSEVLSIDIVLPGGRIRGTVVDSNGTAVKAAVHAAKDGRLIAQQLTGEDGRFDFIGVDEGSYALDAEGESGVARPREERVGKGETIERKLQLQATREITAVVLTPANTPASGALVRLSDDGGRSWIDVVADVEGRFEYSATGTAPLPVIVLTHRYPALFSQLPAEAHGPVALNLQPQGGKLRSRRRAFVAKWPYVVSLNLFFMPGFPQGLYDGAAYLEPGVYSVCPSPVPSVSCKEVTLNVASDELIDFSSDAGGATP